MPRIMIRTTRIALLWLLGAALPAFASPWGAVQHPHPGPAQVLGFYSGGCLAGGRAMALIGEGHQVMRPSRRRYYGHPLLVDFLRDLGRAAAQRGWGRILVGDLAQPRGGPMLSGHRSHQSGLDADLWFRLLPPGLTYSRVETERTSAHSMVNAAAGQVNRRWSPRYATLLRLAAQDTRVQRIFVNPVIKQHLCRHTRGGRDWLAKLRPWWGHDHHFHVRLYCPPGDAACTPQHEPPAGTGCDDGLDQWVEEQRQAALHPERVSKPSKPYIPKPLPAACTAVLNGGP